MFFRICLGFGILLLSFAKINCAKKEVVYASDGWTQTKSRSVGTDQDGIDEFEVPTTVYDAERCGLPMRPPGSGSSEKNNSNPVLSRTKRHSATAQPGTPRRHRKKGRWRPGKGGSVHKVMGGTPMVQGEQPWAVAIFIRHGNQVVYICTGTLVSKRHVLTAAHCFVKPVGPKSKCTEGLGCCISAAKSALSESEVRKRMFVQIGSICLDTPKATDLFGDCNSTLKQRAFSIKSAKYYTTFFDSHCERADLALIELEEEVPASLANHICLMHLHAKTSRLSVKEWKNEAQPAFTYGWGHDPIKQCKSDSPADCALSPVAHIQLLEMPNIWNESECSAKILGRFGPDKLCTIEKPMADVCTGDSGGGLVAQLSTHKHSNKEKAGTGAERRRWFLLGAVSFGTDCVKLFFKKKKPKAMVYTSVNFHRNHLSTLMATDGLLAKAMYEEKN